VTFLSSTDWSNFSVASIEAEKNFYRNGSWGEIDNATSLSKSNKVEVIISLKICHMEKNKRGEIAKNC